MIQNPIPALRERHFLDCGGTDAVTGIDHPLVLAPEVPVDDCKLILQQALLPDCVGIG